MGVTSLLTRPVTLMVTCRLPLKLLPRVPAETFMIKSEDLFRNELIDRRKAGYTPPLSLDLLIVFKQLVEGDEAYAIAAFVQAIVVETCDLNAIGASLLASARPHAGDTIRFHTTES